MRKLAVIAAVAALVTGLSAPAFAHGRGHGHGHGVHHKAPHHVFLGKKFHRPHGFGHHPRFLHRGFGHHPRFLHRGFGHHPRFHRGFAHRRFGSAFAHVGPLRNFGFRHR